MPRRRAALALAAFLSAGSARAAGKALPPPPPAYVHNEGVVSPAAADQIGRELSEFESRTGHQFVVGLFQTLESESLEDYVNRLFKSWKIGSKKRDDGLLFCMFLKERRWRVEVGYGLEGSLTDLEAADIANSAGVPHFKAGDYDRGVASVVEALILRVEQKAEGAAPANRTALPDLEGLKYVLDFLIVFYILFGVTYERGFHWGLGDWGIGRRADEGPRYPLRALYLFGLFLLVLLRLLFNILYYGGSLSGSSSSGGSSGGGFSGGGGSSGGGGASGSW